MKKKTLKKFLYHGLGFPIQLENVTLIQIDGEWAPKINVHKISTTLIKHLPFQKERLTGNQIKFIRTYFEMSLREFARQVVNESHMAVAKWEKFDNKPTNMDLNIEKMLRLYIYERVNISTEKQKQTFFEQYMKLRDMNFSNEAPAPILLKAS